MYGILEIGSNAIKALVYKANNIIADDIYQIKFVSNINTEDGDYIKNNYYLFYNIESILKIFNNFGVKDVRCIATQILRNPTGQKICDYLFEKFRLKVEVLSGEMEAELSGYGIILGINNADGLLIDLGGGSIELAFVQNKMVHMTASFPFGIKTLHGQPISKEQILDITSSKMSLVSSIKHLYLTGGYFRAFAKKYLHFIKTNFKAIHNLEIKTQEFLSFIRKFKKSFDSNLIVKNKMGENNAINMIEALIAKYEPESVIISNYSLKEGIKYQNLPETEKTKDPVLEKVIKITGGYPNLDKNSYINLIIPYITNSGGLFVNFVEIILSYIQYGINIDQSMAGNIISQMVLFGHVNFTNKERIYISLISYISYNASICPTLKSIAKKFLSKEEFLDAYIAGLILFIHNIIDGPLRGSPSFKLEIIKGHILTINKKLPQVLFLRIRTILKEVYSLNKAIKNDQINYWLRNTDNELLKDLL